MEEMIIIQVTRGELAALINEAVASAIQGNLHVAIKKPFIKGIHELADFLHVSPARAQKLKNSKIIPFIQNERLVLFDPDKVLEAMESYNKSKEGNKKKTKS
jgi:hypothetical protein